MPRHFGTGLKYMQLDVGILRDTKVDIMREKFGHMGLTFCIGMYARIFDECYYWEQDDDREIEHFSRKTLYCTLDQYIEMREFSLMIKLFDRGLYEEFGILTSEGIQRRYLEITKRWSKVILIKEFILEDVRLFKYHVILESVDGTYIGYKKKNSDDILTEEFIPRKHKTPEQLEQDQLKQETKKREAEQLIAIEEYSKSDDPTVSEPKPVNGSSYKSTPTLLNQHAMLFYKDDELTASVKEFFGLNEQFFGSNLISFGHFITRLDKIHLIDEFKKQFAAYTEYKILSGETRHTFLKFIGSQSLDFEDSIWQKENYVTKLTAFKKTKNKINGTKKHSGGHTPEDGYGEI